MRWFMLFLVVLILAAGLSCLFVVDQTEYVVVKRFGDPVQTLLKPGLKFKLPWPVDLVVRFDNRRMILESPAAGEADKEYLTKDEQAGIGKNVVVTTYTCWRIRPTEEDVLAFLETMGNRASAELKIGDGVISELGTALGENDFSVLVSTDAEQRKWAELMESIRKKCQARVDHCGIEIADVKLQRLNFPDQNRRNVFDRMQAERETIAAKYRSEGDEQATKIQAMANRERVEIIAKAQMEAEKTRGRADAEAARIYAEAYGQDPDFYEFVRTLEAYEKTFDQSTVAILSADSAFLRLLNQANWPDVAATLEQKDGSASPTTQPADDK